MMRALGRLTGALKAAGAWLAQTFVDAKSWCGLHIIGPLGYFWGMVRAGNLTLMRLLMAPFFFVFGSSLLIDPQTFYTSPAYFIMRAWASSQAWGLVAVSISFVMFICPSENRFAMRLLFLVGALYWSSVAFTVATVNGLSGYAGILIILSLYCVLIHARAGVQAFSESRQDV